MDDPLDDSKGFQSTRKIPIGFHIVTIRNENGESAVFRSFRLFSLFLADFRFLFLFGVQSRKFPSLKTNQARLFSDSDEYFTVDNSFQSQDSLISVCKDFDVICKVQNCKKFP
jgi:hypothetical protein